MIHKLSVPEFFGLIGESIKVGRRFFLVLFLGAIINVGINLGLSFSGIGNFIAEVFNILWVAGVAYVSQTIVVHDKVPVLAQYFVAFQKSSILKRLVPSMIAYMIVSFLFAILLGITGLIVYSMIRGSTAETMTPDEASAHTESLILLSQRMALATSFIGIFITILLMPVTLFNYLLLFRNLHWKESLKLTFEGFKSNFGIFLLYLLPVLFNFILVGILPVMMTVELAQEIQANNWINKFKMGQQIASIVWIPFFTTLLYLMYKRIFRFPQPDNEIALMQ